jgi:ABC-2 type transport system ATP-binding protein
MTIEATSPRRAAGPAAPAQTPALVVDSVGFGYDGKRRVLDDVSFRIERGAIYGLLGPNGAGKSTLMKCLLGLVRPQQGSVEWFGEPLDGSVRRRIGYVPQDLALMYDLTAVDNVRFFGRLYGLRGARLQERVRQALDFVGLWDERTKNPAKYSGGMKRRLNIACGIVHDPDVVIMDEPTVGVDPQSRNAILESIERMQSTGTTVIYISHYMEEVSRLCTRIGVMDAGGFLCEGTLDELLAQYAPEAIVTITATDSEQDVASSVDLDGFTVIAQGPDSVSVSIPSGRLDALGRLAEAASGTVGFSYLAPSLEQVFFRLTQKTLRD